MARFADLSRNEWRKDADKVIWRKVTERILTKYESIDIEDLLQKADGLTEVSLYLDAEYAGFGESEDSYVELSGWRIAVPDEIKEALQAVDVAKQSHQKTMEERAAALESQLRSLKPELFK